ncbi:LETM1-like protein [Catenaria anguillulae PL171]|uniref:LETM1-like protein n=1 Tax=Catenaria anguillulae PL171 TaxID=765915 RepID=A0A1Y2HEA9_9FUNG|nr:LETM1-like protein [Catenaria anguillulae PL171]
MDQWEKRGTSFSAVAASASVTPSRRQVRFVAQVKQDWMRFVPFMVYLAVPFSAFTLPIIIRFAPGMLPTGFRGHRIQELMDHSTLTMQATLGPDLAKVMVEKLDKCSNEIAQDSAMQFQHSILRRMVNDRETQAQYSEILATLPLIRVHLNLGKFDYIDSIKMASFSRITLPFLFPKARLIRRMSIIRQDDALLVRERFVGLSHEEIVEACRMRQLPIPSKEEGHISDEEMLELLKEHARFTERLAVADVPAFVLARVLKSYYVYE